MMMRSDGQVGFPGGFVDEGEAIVQGLNRECFEEIGIDLNVKDEGNKQQL